jgi:tRNA(Ile)-lysidine synthase
VHHGLSPNADAWARACQTFCDQYQIPIDISYIQLTKTPQESLEAQARMSRYSVLKKQLQPQEMLVTAHQQNDQAETVLLQLFRGAGPKGLAAMPLIASFGEDHSLFRPLLIFERYELEQYAIEKQLRWLDDESNRNIAFDRNFIRQELLPLIQTRWPKVITNLARTAQHCAKADQLLLQHHTQTFVSLFDPKTHTLSVSKLLVLNSEVQNHILRYWLQHLGYELPSTKKLQILRQEIVSCRKDAKPLIAWRGVEIRRYRDQLYAMTPLLNYDSSQVIAWDANHDLILPNGAGIITLASLTAQGLDLKTLESVTIRFRQGGERCRLPNRKHSHSLKKLFQDWAIPPWLRDRVPLLYSGKTLKAVIGYVICHE